MNREEAKAILEEVKELDDSIFQYNKAYMVALDMAIKALSQEQQSEWERDHEILKAYADGQESMKPCKDAISRQAVIDYFNSVFSDEFIPFDRARMFIDGIYHAVPSVTPQHCEDAISRQAVKKEFAEWHKGGYENCAFYKYLDKMPPVSIAEKVGTWKKIQSGDKKFPESIVCSRCGYENSYINEWSFNNEPLSKVFRTSKYCPNCGAKMEVEE